MNGMNKIGKVIKPSDTNPWPHEEHVANILSKKGFVVEFIPENKLVGSPDIYLDGVKFEIKSPKSNKPNTWEQRLKDAINNQSCNIIFDSSRIKDVPDYKILSWLHNKYKAQPQIKRLIFVNKRGGVFLDFER